LEKGDSRAAIEAFAESIRLKPDDADAFAGRARAYTQVGDTAAASQDLDTAVALGYDEEKLKRTIQAERLRRIGGSR
jgi:Flp pilus assembly protein TadD